MRSLLLKSVVSLALLSSVVLAQAGNATITGNITDPAGAVVAGAAVQAKNLSTGVVFTAVSTSSGDYTIPDLPAGKYELTCTAQGLGNYVNKNLQLSAG